MIAPIFNEDKGLLTPRSHYRGLKWALEAFAGTKHIYYMRCNLSCKTRCNRSSEELTQIALLIV